MYPTSKHCTVHSEPEPLLNNYLVAPDLGTLCFLVLGFHPTGIVPVIHEFHIEQRSVSAMERKEEQFVLPVESFVIVDKKSEYSYHHL